MQFIRGKISRLSPCRLSGMLFYLTVGLYFSMIIKHPPVVRIEFLHYFLFFTILTNCVLLVHPPNHCFLFTILEHDPLTFSRLFPSPMASINSFCSHCGTILFPAPLLGAKLFATPLVGDERSRFPLSSSCQFQESKRGADLSCRPIGVI